MKIKNKLTKKQEKDIQEHINKFCDESFKLGKKFVLDILKLEIGAGISDGYQGITYGCLLSIIKNFEDEN
jgi:hypothetical protein